MNENNELLEYIYQNSEMAKYSLEKLINELKGKDNKIKKDVEEILKQYEEFYKDLKKYLKKQSINPKENTFLSKLGSLMGIKKEVISDNSDASIADMLIKGISMGILDTEKKLSQYDEKTDKKITNLAKKFISFQQSSIDNLKKYL